MALYLNLNVSVNASQKEIKKAYKVLSLKYHPDKNSDGKEIFQQINDSYNILSNEHLRVIYDYGKLDQYLNIRKGILAQLDDNIINTIKIVIGKDKVTSTYNHHQLMEDLHHKNIDKISAIFLKAYYDHDQVFVSTYINILASAALSSLILLTWRKIKTITPYVIGGIICYYSFNYIFNS